MTEAQFRDAGLQKLSDDELDALNAWLVDFAQLLLGQPGISARTQRTYEIEVSHNDDLFIINGEKYQAKVYCFNMEVGGEVIFVEGSPYGACATAVVVNLRTGETCELWCE
jgi:hypothetical protein